MKDNILDELDDFFKDEEYTDDEKAKFYLSPDNGRYFRWQLKRFKNRYENKEIRYGK